MSAPPAGASGGGRPLDLRRPARVHLVGIGGAGMSGIATILATMGHTVTGSDRRASPALDRLADQGVTVGVGHDLDLVASAEVVGASSAVPPSDPELVEAVRLGLGVRWRVELLAAICELRRTVAVAGTKGKSTTTAMIAHILEAAGERPSLLVGADLPGLAGGARWVPDSDWFVVEADESDGTFLALPAEAVVVTNVEDDHLDCYGSATALREAFFDFASRAARVVVVGVDSPGSRSLVPALTASSAGGGPGSGTRPAAARGAWGAAPAGGAALADGAASAGGPVSGGGAGPADGAAPAGGGSPEEATGVPAAFRAARELLGLRSVTSRRPGAAGRASGGPRVVTFGTAEDAEVRVLAVRSERASARFSVLPGPLGAPAGETASAGPPAPRGIGGGSRVPGVGVPPVARAGGPVLEVELSVPGLHNARNATGALALAASIGIGLEVGVGALATYRPVGRRFEWRGEQDGVGFVDDYAHVPSAVEATLATARDGGWRRIVAVFQPHLYSRTEALGGALGEALSAADLVVVTDVYGAREDPRPGVDGRIVAEAARRARPDLDVRYVAERSSLASVVRDLLRPGDLCLSLGAGDITALAGEIARLGAPGEGP